MRPLVHVTSVDPLGDYTLRLTFEDGTTGTLDLEGQLWGPVFEPLKDRPRFAEVRVDEVCGTIVWPNGADFAPEWLYDAVSATSTAQGG